MARPNQKLKPKSGADETKSQREDEVSSDEEIAKRRDDGLRRLLRKPPKTHAEIAGKGKPKQKQGGSSPKR